MNRTPSLFAGVEPIEVFVELLDQLDTDTGQEEFYDRICEAICRLTTMRRAGIFMSEGRGHRIRAVGAHGISIEQLNLLRPTLLGTPVAQRALRSDQVIAVTPDQIRAAVPPEYVDTLGITTLVCTPLSAAGRSYGVICADRGGDPFDLSDGEQHLLWTLGKTAALVATARITTREEEQARRLSERLALAREIHERVVQRLFGVSLALTVPGGLDVGELERCRDELQDAIGELRAALERPLQDGLAVAHGGGTLAAELERLAGVGVVEGADLLVDWPDGVEVPIGHEGTAQAFLAEAVRNASKHARPTRIEVAVAGDEEMFCLEVRNNGVEPGPRGAGMGLRLAAFEALQHGGMVEFGPTEGDGWRVRMVLPL
jgi:signal transduction histidine kinase